MESRPGYRARNGSTPTVLLVHDAFADSSIWAATIAACRRVGADCVAVANPLRGLRTDADYVAATAATIDGPVVMVGHGYGGAVVGVAAVAAANVTALACVAGFALDVGERCIDMMDHSRHPSQLLPALRPRRLRLPPGDVTELTIDAALYSDVAAADLPPDAARSLASCQRPVAATALEDHAPVAAWRSSPFWYLVAAQDRLLRPDVQRAMAQRAGATVLEADASHAVLVSRPDAVASLIAAASQK